MKFSQNSFNSEDGHSKVFYSLWEPEGDVCAVLQISHGMCEYVGRYEKFAAFLTEHGFAVCGNDHIGHGRSVSSDSELGYIPRKNGAEILVGDVHTLTGILKQKYSGVPLFLLGHSMGSFIARLYISKYGNELAGAVIMGTGGPGNPTGIAKALARMNAALFGNYNRSHFINKIAFGSYTKRFGKNASKNAWLTKDDTIVEKYSNDKFCTYIFTADGFYTLFDMISRVSSKNWAPTLPKSLPMLVVSGEDDPVGNYGKGVRTVYSRIQEAGAEDVSLKLYPGDRHEVLNETDCAQVYDDILRWLEDRIK